MKPQSVTALAALLGGMFFAAPEALAQNPCEQAFHEARRLPTRAAALAHLEPLKVRCGADPEYLARLGRFYFEVDRLADAEGAVTAGLKLAPTDEGLLFNAGDIRLRRGDVTGAKSFAVQLAQAHPASHSGPYLMQRVLIDSRQFAEALVQGERAIVLSKGTIPVIYLNNAVAAYNAGYDKRCVDYAQKAIELDPRFLAQAWGINEAIYALDRSKRFAEALALAKRRKDADPNWQSDAVLVKALKVMGVVQ